MTYLAYNNQLRTETSVETINTLLRKGWVENPPPSYDPSTQRPPMWDQGQWLVEDKTAEELAADNRKIWANSSDYIQEFTFQEMSAINLSTDPTVAALRLLLACWNGEVWSDDPRVIAGLDALESTQIINATRRAEILSF